jgi:formylmethanofuran dehydrogenase subunit E
MAPIEPIDEMPRSVTAGNLLLETSCCSRCGRKFKSADEKINMDDHRCICATCYNQLVFPEMVTRCPE